MEGEPRRARKKGNMKRTQRVPAMKLMKRRVKKIPSRERAPKPCSPLCPPSDHLSLHPAPVTNENVVSIYREEEELRCSEERISIISRLASFITHQDGRSGGGRGRVAYYRAGGVFE